MFLFIAIHHPTAVKSAAARGKKRQTKQELNESSTTAKRRNHGFFHSHSFWALSRLESKYSFLSHKPLAL